MVISYNHNFSLFFEEQLPVLQHFNLTVHPGEVVALVSSFVCCFICAKVCVCVMHNNFVDVFIFIFCMLNEVLFQL